MQAGLLGATQMSELGVAHGEVVQQRRMLWSEVPAPLAGPNTDGGVAGWEGFEDALLCLEPACLVGQRRLHVPRAGRFRFQMAVTQPGNEGRPGPHF